MATPAPGRLAAPERILAAIVRVLSGGDLAGTHVVVSAGGTREPIDAVRAIANRSSGKQAMPSPPRQARPRAQVTLVSTVDLAVPFGVTVLAVETAQMEAAATGLAPAADVVVMVAAVADFRPVAAVPGKLKKDQGVPQISSSPLDILAVLGATKPAGQVLVGFASRPAICWCTPRCCSASTST